ncbi:hypothetical protein FSP39_018489 [Pinctada imbricata]|uniref:Uncharacterized protein n=1 Tax=Pinctada imbricata TaxID=66713 RepID=A0AA88XFX7_PINIB|nr:hypothetical protein FSP39_018489 [Pinctada imbricata]
MGNSSSSEELSTAGIICIAAACYTALILILVLVRYILVRRGVCGESKCAPCGSEEGPGCCSCCQSIAESDGCKCDPSLRGCLNNCCPKSKKLDPSCCTIGQCPASTGCDFSCQECQSINCCCFEIKIKQSTPHTSVANNMQSFRQAPPPHSQIANQMPVVIQNQPVSSQVPPSSAIIHQPTVSEEISSQFYTNKAYDESDENKDNAMKDTRRQSSQRKSSSEMTVETKQKVKRGNDTKVRFTEEDTSIEDANARLARDPDSGDRDVNTERKPRKKKTSVKTNDPAKEERLVSDNQGSVTRPKKKTRKVHSESVPNNSDENTTKQAFTQHSLQGISATGGSVIPETNNTSKRSLPARPLKVLQKSQIMPEVLTSKPPKSPKRKT